MKAIFFESNSTLLAKNLFPVASLLNKKKSNFKALFISADIASVDQMMENESIAKIKSEKNFYYLTFKSFNYKKIEKFLYNEKPDILFIDCYRLIDQLWIGIANSLGIKTYMLQHGFEIDTVYYKLFSIFTKFAKGARLVNASYNLSRFLKVSFVALFWQYFKYIYMGVPLKNTFLGNETLHPSKVFLYSDYYKDFWNNKFGFSVKKTKVINPPDFLLIENVKKKEREIALCYITQTLVEDGRMKKKIFLRLMEEYKEIAKNINKFIIKLHPRGNSQLYSTFKGLNNVVITREFPNCTAYLTHYTSMAFVAAYLSDTVIFHEIEGHPTPQIFEAVPSAIVKDTFDIIPIFNEGISKKVPNLDLKKQKLTYYASFDDIDIYEKIYNSIMQDNLEGN